MASNLFAIAVIVFMIGAVGMVSTLVAWPFAGVRAIYPYMFGSWAAMFMAWALMMAARGFLH